MTSHELLPKFRNILKAKTDKIRTIIYIENPIQRTDTSGYRQGREIQTKAWSNSAKELAGSSSASNQQTGPRKT